MLQLKLCDWFFGSMFSIPFQALLNCCFFLRKGDLELHGGFRKRSGDFLGKPTHGPRIHWGIVSVLQDGHADSDAAIALKLGGLTRRLRVFFKGHVWGWYMFFLGFLDSIRGGFKDDPVVTCTWNTLLFQLDVSVKTHLYSMTHSKNHDKNCQKKIQESMASLWHSSRRRYFQTFGTRENCGDFWRFLELWWFQKLQYHSSKMGRQLLDCLSLGVMFILLHHTAGLAKPGSWRVLSNSGGEWKFPPSWTTLCKRLVSGSLVPV